MSCRDCIPCEYSAHDIKNELCLHFATPAWSKEYRLLGCMVDPEPKIDREFLNVKADVPGFDIAGLSHCLSRTRSAQVWLQVSSRILSLTSIARKYC